MNKREIARQKAIEAMKSMRARAAELGLTDMSLDEINAEIDATQCERDRFTASSLMIRAISLSKGVEEFVHRAKTVSPCYAR